MKTKPILFSTPMIQALLEGRKTQTRRSIKKQPDPHHIYLSKAVVLDGTNRICLNYSHGNSLKVDSVFPKYQPGDILWVRETTRVGAWRFQKGAIAFDYKASPELKKTPWSFIKDSSWFESEMIKVSDELKKKGVKPDYLGDYYWKPGESPLNWKPSIFMPKAACRIFLEVTNVRVERLQDISKEDAIQEGVLFQEGLEKFNCCWYDYEINLPVLSNPKSSFKSLWQSINGKISWDANPWVWVYDFIRVEKPSNF